MDLRQLRYAVTLAETLSFRRAAELQHITQSTFSEQIARLEREVGARLFDRDSHRVQLTVAGALFVDRATKVLADMRETTRDVREIHHGASGTLRVGVFAEGAGELTPLLVEAFRRASPSVAVSFAELSIPMQVSALLGDEVDVAIVRPPILDDRLVLEELFHEPRAAVLPEHHPFSGRASLAVEDLLDDPVIVAPMPVAWGAFWSCDDERGEPGRVAATVSSVAESLAAVAYLGAVDTVPASAARHFRHPGIRYVPITDARPASVAVARRRDEGRASVRAFCEAAVLVARRNLGVVPGAVLRGSAEPA